LANSCDELNTEYTITDELKNSKRELAGRIEIRERRRVTTGGYASASRRLPIKKIAAKKQTMRVTACSEACGWVWRGFYRQMEFVGGGRRHRVIGYNNAVYSRQKK